MGKKSAANRAAKRENKGGCYAGGGFVPIANPLTSGIVGEIQQLSDVVRLAGFDHPEPTTHTDFMTVLAIHDGANKLIRAIGGITDGDVTLHCEGWNSLSLDSVIIRLVKLLGDLRDWCRSQERDPARPLQRLAQKPIIPPALRDELHRIAELARTMPTVAEQITQHASTGPQPAADKNTRGRKPKLVDPQEDDIRQKYNQVRTIKGTIEALALKSLRRVTAHTRVQRIVNADKRAKSRAKSS